MTAAAVHGPGYRAGDGTLTCSRVQHVVFLSFVYAVVSAVRLSLVLHSRAGIRAFVRERLLEGAVGTIRLLNFDTDGQVARCHRLHCGIGRVHTHRTDLP